MAVIVALIELLLVFFILKTLFNFFRAFFLRISFYSRLKKMCNNAKHTFIKNRSIFASFFSPAKQPEIKIQTDNTEFLVCFITCYARKRFYFFINEKYYIRSMKLYMALPMAKKVDSTHIFDRLKKAPYIDKNVVKGHLNPPQQKVLLFNPAPVEIAHLEESGTKNTIDGNGSELYQWKIFDGNSFLNYLKQTNEKAKGNEINK